MLLPSALSKYREGNDEEKSFDSSNYVYCITPISCYLVFPVVTAVIKSLSYDGFASYTSAINNKDAHCRELIDYSDDDEKCLLSQGIWYKYNDDYLSYINTSISEIGTVYEPKFDFSEEIQTSFLSSLENSDESVEKYYAELIFNKWMGQEYGFSVLDRHMEKVGRGKIEIADLYKDGTLYAVKIGNSSSKLCYAIDQSLTALRMIKNGELPKDRIPQEITTIAIWFILERKTHIKEKNGKPDLSSLEMTMLKNRLDQWKKEVRLLGYKPLVMINYRS